MPASHWFHYLTRVYDPSSPIHASRQHGPSGSGSWDLEVGIPKAEPRTSNTMVDAKGQSVDETNFE